MDPAFLRNFGSAALVHAAYLHNRLIHSALNKTPYKAWCGRKPDITNLKMFGARVCVKRTGLRWCKLDHHGFTGIFLGYTATDQNILYLDLNLGIIKSCHHAIFDEAWYMQPTRPPAARLLYDLGLELDFESVLVTALLTLFLWSPPKPHGLHLCPVLLDPSSSGNFPRIVSMPLSLSKSPPLLSHLGHVPCG
jgi:hypothetical protein